MPAHEVEQASVSPPVPFLCAGPREDGCRRRRRPQFTTRAGLMRTTGSPGASFQARHCASGTLRSQRSAGPGATHCRCRDGADFGCRAAGPLRRCPSRVYELPVD